MLYFIYQYLQGIAHDAFTAVNMGSHALKFVLDSSADLTKSLESLNLPMIVKVFFALVFSLALIDKFRG